MTWDVGGQQLDSETQPSLATCRLQIIPNSSQPARMDSLRRRRSVGKPLTDYQRDRGIDWRVPKTSMWMILAFVVC